MSDSPKIDFYGAEWCGDCRRTKRLLDKHGVAYNYLDTANDETAMMKAVEISGRQSIPVVKFSDGSFFVEPSDPDMEAKLREIGLIS
jgi:mycoredoxin